MNEAPYLSIVIPVFDEQDSVVTLHREIDAAIANVAGGVEILFVDDSSTDASAQRLREIATRDARVRVLTLDHQCGQSAALAAGFDAVRGDVTATLDADLQNDPADLPGLLERLDEADVVCGIRAQRCDTWSRRVSARIANGFRNALTRESVSDVGCSLRVMRTPFVKKLKMYRGMHRFLPTLLVLEGARVIEVPVSHRPRRYGRSKYGIFDRLWVGIADVLAVRWIQSRSLRYRAIEDKREPSGTDA